jgi:hypothetical protein
MALMNSTEVAIISTGSTGLLTLTYTSTVVNQTYNLPSDGTSGQVLSTNGSGVLSWSGTPAVSVKLNSILAATATNTIDSLNFAQVWNWSTASTQTPFTWNGNGLTSGTLFSLASSATGLTGNLLNITLSGTNAANTGNLLNLNSSGAASTAVCVNITQAGSANLITASTTGASNAISLVQTTAATSGANNNSPIYKSTGTYWTGSVTANDVWSNQIVLGAGANPASTYSLVHTGSTGVAAVQLPAGGSLLFPGSVSGTVGFKPAGTNTSVTWQLPAADGTNGQVLQTNGSGVLTWTSSPVGVTIPLNDILAATATNTIDSLNFSQVWNWSTASSQSPFTWNANGLTSATLFSLASSATGLTGNLLSLTLSGSNAANTGNLLNINSSGAASTAVCLNITQSGSANLITASTTGASNAISLVQTTAATSGANNNSPIYKSTGTYWTGSVTANDVWSNQIVLGTGANPTSTYALVHTGSTGVAAVQLPSGASLLFPGSSSGTVGFKPAAANTSVTWQLPAADGSPNQFLQTNGSGVLTFAFQSTSVALSSILAATGTNTIDSLTFAQVWNWSTASTQSPFTWNANGLTSGTLFSLASSATGLTGNLLNITLSGTNAANTGNLLNLNSSGAASTAVCVNITQSGTANLITASTTGASNAISLVQTTAATSGANNNSPQYKNTGTYWTGSVTANDVWSNQIVLGTGANPTTTYSLTHTGSTGVAAVQLPAGASLLFPGSSSGTVGFKPAAANTSVTWQLPAADGTTGQVLQTNGSGILTWTSSPSAVTVPLNNILAATATNTIDSLTFAQVWNWSTSSTQSPFTWNANGLTSGTLFSLASSATGLTGNLLNIALSGTNAANTGNLLNINSSGAASTAVCLNITQAGSANLITASTTGASNAISLVQTTAATSGANNNSPIYKSTGTYWTGAVTANDVWSQQIVLGAGANPTTTYNLTHTGSTGTAALQLPAGGSLLFPGSVSGTVGFKPAGTNTSVTWQLPAADGTNGQVLQTNGSGILTWTSSPSAVTVPLNNILAATNTNTIDSLTFAQVWNWSTASTQTPFTWNGNGLTSGTLFSLASSATGLTGNLLNLTLSGSNAANTGNLLNINSSGASSTAVCLNIVQSGTANLITASTTGASNAISLVQTTAATSGANNNSPIYKSTGTYWTGAVTANDVWSNQIILGSGANPTTTYSLTHTGSTGTAALQLPAGASLLFPGSSSGTVGFKPAATNTSVTWQLPAADGTANQFLQTNGSGVLTFASQSTSVALNTISAATATNTIDSLTFAQVWNWSTASTQTPFTWNANGLTSGTLFSLASSATGLTGNLLNIALSGSNAANTGNLLNINSSGASSTAVCLNITQSGSANLITASTTTASNAISLVQTTAATSGANNNSPIYKSTGTYWTGSVTANDVWSQQIVLGTGANPSTTYSLTHTGSTGVAALQLPLGASLLFPGSSSGTVGFKPAATNTSVTWQLPAADGSANQFLQTNGSGVLTFASGGSGTVTFTNTTTVTGNLKSISGNLWATGSNPSQQVILKTISDGTNIIAYARFTIWNVTSMASGGAPDGIESVTAIIPAAYRPPSPINQAIVYQVAGNPTQCLLNITANGFYTFSNSTGGNLPYTGATSYGAGGVELQVSWIVA